MSCKVLGRLRIAVVETTLPVSIMNTSDIHSLPIATQEDTIIHLIVNTLYDKHGNPN